LLIFKVNIAYVWFSDLGLASEVSFRIIELQLR